MFTYLLVDSKEREKEEEVGGAQSSGAASKSRWTSCSPRPITFSPCGLCGRKATLTPSLPQPGTFPGRKTHGCACKLSIFRSNDTPTSNAMSFDENTFTCQCETEDKLLKGFKFRNFVGCFQVTSWVKWVKTELSVAQNESTRGFSSSSSKVNEHPQRPLTVHTVSVGIKQHSKKKCTRKQKDRIRTLKIV